MRLINADYLRSTYSITHAHFDSIESIRQWIDKVPTIDAEPVRHGKWEEVQFRTIPHNRISKAKKCSECGKRKDKYVTWIYCPNCGAKMDEDGYCSDGERRDEDDETD